jgi:hypothetical protein
VERALDAVTDDGAAVADVSAEMFAVSFQDMQRTVFVAVGDQILAEIAQRRTSPIGNSGDQPTMNNR